MTNNPIIIDRGTLLRGSGAVALLGMLTACGPTKTNTTETAFCCDPGDLGFGYVTTGSKKTRVTNFETLGGLLLIARAPGSPAPPPQQGWQPRYYIPAADGFGTEKGGGKNDTKDQDLYIYTK